MASLKPKLFCGVASFGREVSTFARVHGGTTTANLTAATRTIYATITVKRPFFWSGNASTPTEPTGRCLLLQTLWPETGDYKGAGELCQATNGTRWCPNLNLRILFLTSRQRTPSARFTPDSFALYYGGVVVSTTPPDWTARFGVYSPGHWGRQSGIAFGSSP